MTPVGRDDPARRLKGRNPQRLPKNSETRREGQAPPLRDERGNVPQRGTGESGTRPYGVTGKHPPAENGRAATEGRPYGGFNSPVWFQRDRRGFVAVVAIASPRTEIAL